LSRKNLIAIVCVVTVMAMTGAAFAAVPLYRIFCQVTGFDGTVSRADAAPEEVLDETVLIRFDTNVRDLPMVFRAEQVSQRVHIGETGIAFYEAYNPTDHPIAGTASYNVTPYSAGSYFIKIACFCFTLQVLQPGERVQMPVTFYVDPEIVNDPDVRAQGLSTITLSYTFHPTEIPAGTPAAELTTN